MGNVAEPEAKGFSDVPEYVQEMFNRLTKFSATLETLTASNHRIVSTLEGMTIKLANLELRMSEVEIENKTILERLVNLEQQNSTTEATTGNETRDSGHGVGELAKNTLENRLAALESKVRKK